MHAVPLAEALREGEGSDGGEPLAGLRFQLHYRTEVGVDWQDPVGCFNGRGQHRFRWLVPSKGGEAGVNDD
ncbi:hypothetical protein FH972_015404 [Carpinus fangiana]|uniref:Uncharacterized protein n=1 Tax=Carpinus fangiana TaxID=176857 RepID=A0A5N6RG36_9ROSI|nr:hypothetical protein FH972_015404 [Carpinus fangiana]